MVKSIILEDETHKKLLELKLNGNYKRLEDVIIELLKVGVEYR